MALDTRLQKLEILESVLHQYQEPQFKIMGNILLEIQRHKMYSLRTCKNLREYVLKHHTFQWRSARRYMNAVRVMDFLADRHEVLPTSEKQVRWGSTISGTLMDAEGGFSSRTGAALSPRKGTSRRWLEDRKPSLWPPWPGCRALGATGQLVQRAQ